MTTFIYNFHEMKKWYENNLENEDIFNVAPEMHIWKFNKIIDAKDKIGYNEQFLLKSIRKIRSFKPISEKYKTLYLYNVYIILDYDPNWVLFVYPTKKYDNNGNAYPYLFADHYSIAFNPDTSKKQIQSHETIYNPIRSPDNLIGLIGSTQKINHHFKNNMIMHKDSYKEELFKSYVNISIKRESMLDMLKFYAIYESQSAGGKRDKQLSISKPNTKVTRKYSKKIEIDKTDSLDKKWKQYKLDHALICALKNTDGKYGVTVSFHDHQIRNDGEVHNGFFFVMDTLDHIIVKNKIIEYIKTQYTKSSGSRRSLDYD